MSKLMSIEAINRIKKFAENESLGWVDVHGDIWNLLNAYADTMRENESLRKQILDMGGCIAGKGYAHGCTIPLDSSKHTALEATPLNKNALKPYEGWQFIFDDHGVAYHVPDAEVLRKMCDMYYGKGIMHPSESQSSKTSDV